MIALEFGLDLADLRRIDVFGQIVDRASHGVAHVVGRAVDIAVEGELDRDVRAPVLARGVDGLDAVDAADRILDHIGDAGVDDRRRGTAIGCLHGDHWRIDVGQLAQRQVEKRQSPEGDEEKAHHHGEDGTFDGDIGKNHGGVTRRS